MWRTTSDLHYLTVGAEGLYAFQFSIARYQVTISDISTLDLRYNGARNPHSKEQRNVITW